MADDNDRDQPASAEGAESAVRASAAADPESEPADLPARIDAGVARILQAFEEKLKYDASKQQAVDRLHSELQGHRAGLVEKAARPFIFGMIRHHAEIGKLLAGLRDIPEDELSPVKFGRLLESLQEDVEEVLAENGVVAYRAEVSQRFDPVRQTVVGEAVQTADEAQSGTIAACLGPGFEHEGRILVKARVSAYRSRPRSSPS